MARFREGTGVGLLVAIATTGLHTLLAGVLAVLIWTAFSIYAIVEIVGDGEPSALVVMLTVVLLVGGLVTLIAVGIGVLGKSLAPAKRDRG
jgi:hypothetical protein